MGNEVSKSSLRRVELVRYVKKKAMLALLSSLRIAPVKKNRIIMDNSLSHTFSDSPKYIAKKLLADYPGRFEIIFSVRDPENYAFLNDMGIKTVRFGSFQYYLSAMTSSVYVTNSGGYSYLPLKKSQLVINTWHGGGCYKKMGQDKVNVSSSFKDELILAAEKTGYITVSCKMFSDAIENALLIGREKHLLVGLPRDDILVNYGSDESRKIRKETRERLGINDGQKLVMFSPTYRKPKGEPFGRSIAAEYGIEPDRVCGALSQRFGGEWVFGFRLHPSIRNEIGVIPQNALDLTEYEDMQELILAADVMINDFSSCMWDFMLTGKPCFTFAIDMREYIRYTQVYSPVSDWPFPKAETNDGLVDNILNFDENNYKRECDRHYKDLGGCETGRATDEVAEIIRKHCLGQ